MAYKLYYFLSFQASLSGDSLPPELPHQPAVPAGGGDGDEEGGPGGPHQTPHCGGDEGVP